VFNVRENMSLAHYVKSYLRSLKDNNPITRFMLYRRTYQNHFEVIRHMKRREFPFEARLRGGKNVTITHPNEVYANLSGLSYEPGSDTVTVDGVKFYRGLNNGEVAGIFLAKQYDSLPVNGKIVVDVGANIADSSIYFARKGAQKVIALEPFPKNYETAKKNIELNNLEGMVFLTLAACSYSSGSITIDPDRESNITSQISEPAASGIKVPTMTLEDIVKAHLIDSAILKMDCEGCEYDSILQSSKETLQKFTHVQLEYHYGYKNLKQKLEESGFKVAITGPKYTAGRYQKMYVGWLWAQRSS
jgi:FkbM family methyltransferase